MVRAELKLNAVLHWQPRRFDEDLMQDDPRSVSILRFFIWDLFVIWDS